MKTDPIELSYQQSSVNVIYLPGKGIMSSVAVNCCSVPQKWPTMPSDLIYSIQPEETLVVEDNERAAKAVEGSGNGKDTINGVPPVQKNISRPMARDKFTIPRVPSTFAPFVPTTTSNGPCDSVDAQYATVCKPPKAKLKSFEERKEPKYYHAEYYHDASFLKSEVSLNSSGEPVEKDDEGDHRDDNLNPLRPDIKEGSSLYVQLPQKPQCTDLPPTLQEPLSDHYAKNCHHDDSPKKEKPSNNNKERDAENDSSCVVDCLYYTIQCCDCSIM